MDTLRIVRILVSNTGDNVLVALVNALTGGSVPEHVVRSQARRVRRGDSVSIVSAPLGTLAA